MPKNCCAVGCSDVYKKGYGLQFYRFPVDPDRRRRWIAAVDRKGWEPTEYTWNAANTLLLEQRATTC